MGIRDASLGIQEEVTHELNLHRHVGVSWGRETGGSSWRWEQVGRGIQDPRIPVVYRAGHRALEGGERVEQEEARGVNKGICVQPESGLWPWWYREPVKHVWATRRVLTLAGTHACVHTHVCVWLCMQARVCFNGFSKSTENERRYSWGQNC